MINKKSLLYSAILFLIVAMFILSQSRPGNIAIAQESDTAESVVQVESSQEGVAAVAEQNIELEYLSQPPQLTEIQLAQLEEMNLQVNLPGPALPLAEEQIEGPLLETETVINRNARQVPGSPLANGDFSIFRKRSIWSTQAANSRSNVSEVSVAGSGKYMFATGNWWAAKSTNGGKNWTYVNPYSGMSRFCCDQIVMYDKARNLLLWLRMSRFVSGESNLYKILASTNGGASWTAWNFYSPSGEWYDYPHWALSNDFIYLATNSFDNTGGGGWTRTRMLRLPLDSFRDKVTVYYSFHDNFSEFNATPTQGATDTMYWGTHISTSSLRIREWPEDSNTITVYTRTIPAWTSTGRGSADCGHNYNWGGRTDHRILVGWVAKGEIGFMWNVQEGNGFTFPYVNAATFKESDKSYIGRPLVWNPNYCWLYPSMSVNARGDLGMVINGGTTPNLYASIDDDYNGTPPGWEVKWVHSSYARPSDDKWGDYNTSRPNSPTDINWIGGGHTIFQNTCCKASIWFFAFGRQRDSNSYWYWQNK